MTQQHDWISPAVGAKLIGFLCSVFLIGEGASSCSHPRIMPTLLPAGLGDRDGRRNQSETRVSVAIRVL